jgi:hypothetical protein
MNQDQILRLLKQLGTALSTGDLAAASSCWDTPALILSDAGAMAVASRSEIESIFAEATKWYHERGLTSTEPEIERMDVLSETLVSVDVRWPAYDASRNEKSSERSHYIIHAPRERKPHIRVALTRTK